MNIWQKLMNKLFGINYVAITFGGVHEVRRVMYLPNGEPYVWLYGSIERLNSTNRQVIYLSLG